MRNQCNLAAWLTFLLSATLSLFIIALRIEWISIHDFPPSNNAYFYLLEIRNWMDIHAGYYGKLSPFFPAAAALGQLFSLNEREVFDGAVVVSLFLLSSTIVLIGWRRDHWWLMPFLFALPWISDVVFFRHNAFLKQAVSWAFFLFGFALLLRAREIENILLKRAMQISGVFCALFGLASHLFTFCVGSALCLFVFVKNKKQRMIGAVLIAVVLILGASLTGKELLQWPAWNLTKDVHLMFRGGDVDESFLIFEMIAVAIAWFFMLVVILLRKDRREPLLLALLTLIAFFLAPWWSRTSALSLRLLLACFWIFYPLLARYSSLIEKRFEYAALSVYCSLILFAGFLLRHEQFGRNSISKGLLPVYKNEIRAWIKPDAFIRAPMGVQFAVTYHLGLPSADEPAQERVYGAYYRIRKYHSAYDDCYAVKKGASVRQDTSCLRFGRQWIIEEEGRR